MKILSAFLLLVLLQNVATAAPLHQNFELEVVDTSPHEAGLAMASLEKRVECRAILASVFAKASSAGL